MIDFNLKEIVNMNGGTIISHKTKSKFAVDLVMKRGKEMFCFLVHIIQILYIKGVGNRSIDTAVWNITNQ